MTQPSLNTTFDTSIIDLLPPQEEINKMPDEQTSFSTTESASSEPSTANEHSKAKPPIRHVPTVDAYNTWAEVYDTDGNMLQSIDDHELETLLPEFLQLVIESTEEAAGEKAITIVDLGCGTGRNTQKLIHAPWPSNCKVKITAIDASDGMLTIARQKLRKPDNPTPLPPKIATVEFHMHDFLNPIAPNTETPPLFPQTKEKGKRATKTQKYTALLSTLVLEHFPLPPFYNALSTLLGKGGLALITNMHPHMGAQSQAGFRSKDTGGQVVKIRGTSWVHGVQETMEAAAKYGFEVVGEVREGAVSEEMVGRGVVGERGRKWIGVNVWYGFLLRKV